MFKPTHPSPTLSRPLPPARLRPPRRLVPGLALAIGALGLTAGCATGPQINHASDPRLEPSSYATFRLVDHEVGHTGAEARISGAVHDTMSLRGFEAAEGPQADLLVSVKVLTTGNVEPDAVGAQVAGGAAGGALGGAEVFALDPASTDVEVEKLVLVQLLDARSQRVVWVGWSQERVRPSQLEQAAAEAVSRIMRRVPSRGLAAAG
jgi:hypothetical protein